MSWKHFESYKTGEHGVIDDCWEKEILLNKLVNPFRNEVEELISKENNIKSCCM